MPEAGWVRDPSGRYHQRYFDGVRWTEHVADEYGRRAIDPVEGAQQAPAASPLQPGAGTPAFGTPAQGAQGSSPYLPATTGGPRLFESQLAEQSAPAQGPPAPAMLLTAIGTAVAVIAICFLPWAGDRRVFTLPAPSLFDGWSQQLQFSFFEIGWLVTLICVFVALTFVALGTPRQAIIAVAPIATCALWALAGTIWTVVDLDAVDFSFGFFVGAAGIIGVTTGTILAAVAKPSR